MSRTPHPRSPVPRSPGGVSPLPRLLAGAAAALLLAGCPGDERAGEPPSPGAAAVSSAAPAGAGGADASDPFVDRAEETGLDFVHFNGMSGELYLAEITCAGGGFLDVDGDGDLDVYFPQGRMLGPGKILADATVPPRHPAPLTDRLYRNDLLGPGGAAGPLAFTDVTAQAGIAPTPGYGCTVAAGDFDNDGATDLFVGNLGPDLLLRNRGDGSFEDVTARAGVSDPFSSVAASFFDYDRDGSLDLFVANNVDFRLDAPPPCFDLTGAPDYCGPGAFVAQPDRLWRNRGDGTFEDATARAGMAGVARPSLGVVTADLDGDGWLDVYVANDGQPNHLWINRGDGTFREEALLAGCAVNGKGDAEASMGVDADDFDGDGDLDLVLAHLIKETNTLYVNDGGGLFADGTAAAGLAAPSLPYTSFGAGWLDYDNDGWLDLAVVNGAVTHLPELKRRGNPFPLHQVNQLFHNLGGGRFEEVTARAGRAFERSEVSRAAAFGDVDNDGDPDLLVVNNNGPARLLVNQVGQRRPWIGLRLVGASERPRDLPGARAALLRPGRPPLWRRVKADGSYNATNDSRLLFGLGDAAGEGGAEVSGVRVLWPDGTREDFPPPPAGRYTTLRQGGGRVTED